MLELLLEVKGVAPGGAPASLVALLDTAASLMVSWRLSPPFLVATCFVMPVRLDQEAHARDFPPIPPAACSLQLLVRAQKDILLAAVRIKTRLLVQLAEFFRPIRVMKILLAAAQLITNNHPKKIFFFTFSN